MTITRRIAKLLYGLLLLVGCALIIFDPEWGYLVVCVVLSFGLMLRGLKEIWYYISMARHKVGGLTVLFKGILFFDFGMFLFVIPDVPKSMIMLYLLGMQLFDGVMKILKARDARKLQSQWKLDMSIGVIQVLIVIVGIFFIQSMFMLAVVVCVGLIQNAIGNIIVAFRKTSIVYIE